jgi:hypothetical protein
MAVKPPAFRELSRWRPSPSLAILLATEAAQPWRQARPFWNFAAELMLKTAQTGKKTDTEAATPQMERALRSDGWL